MEGSISGSDISRSTDHSQIKHGMMAEIHTKRIEANSEGMQGFTRIETEVMKKLSIIYKEEMGKEGTFDDKVTKSIHSYASDKILTLFIDFISWYIEKQCVKLTAFLKSPLFSLFKMSKIKLL
jgi:hypothetical protein